MSENYPLVFDKTWADICEYARRQNRLSHDTFDIVKYIQVLTSDLFIFCAPGKFDQWAVYIGKTQMGKDPVYAMPCDREYLARIQQHAEKHGVDNVLNDIFCIFNRTRKELDKTMFPLIDYFSSRYGSDRDDIRHTYLWLYYAMIAEENRTFPSNNGGVRETNTGGSIKMLAVYRVLKEHMDIQSAADECRGCVWPDIQAKCEPCGIHWYKWKKVS